MQDENWRRYTSEELEEKLKQKPITREDLERFTSVNEVYLSFNKNWEKGLTMHGCPGGKPRYYIFMGLRYPYEEILETFAHEITHVVLRCGCTSAGTKDDLKVEGIVEREALRLLKEHRDSVERIFRHYVVPSE